MPSRDFTSEDLFSSRMMSMHSSTHSSQMNTVGPAMSLRTSCWLFPQKEQYSVLLVSPLAALVIGASHTLRRPLRGGEGPPILRPSRRPDGGRSLQTLGHGRLRNPHDPKVWYSTTPQTDQQGPL